MSIDVVPARALIGRQSELRRILELLSGSDETTQGSVLVTSARGVGRSAVFHAALARLDLPALRLLGQPGRATFDYQSLADALGAATGHPVFGPQVSSWLMVVHAAQAQAPCAVGRELLELLRSPRRITAAVLAIDDVQLFDRASQDVVAYLAQHGRAVGLQCLFTADEVTDLSAFAGLERVGLSPLAPDQLRVLLERKTGAPLPYRVGRLLHAWSDGNPALALDLISQLSAPERAGTSPIGLPLVPTPSLVERLGRPVNELPPSQRRLLAAFARCDGLPVDSVPMLNGGSPEVLDDLVAAGWLTVSQWTVSPARRLDALLAWAKLAPSVQQEVSRQLADLLHDSAPAAGDYFASLGGDPAAWAVAVPRAHELYLSGRGDLAAAACALALQLGTLQSDPANDDPANDDPANDPAHDDVDDPAVTLGRLLTADGYSHAARSHVRTLQTGPLATSSAVLALVAELAAVTSDATDAVGFLATHGEPGPDVDGWLQAALTICRVQLALDGADESMRLFRSVERHLPRATAESRALAAVVAAEGDMYREAPGTADVLHRAVRTWMAVRSGGIDLNWMSAAIDLLALGRVGEARELLSSAGVADQLAFATSRSAVTMLRTETEIAAGHYRRAAASLIEQDHERPSPSGADLMVASQAVRIGAVCDDVGECGELEERLLRSVGVVMSYPARRSHTAALGFRELVHGNFEKSRDLLSLAMQGPALLLQGRSCILADLVEATAAAGDRTAAAETLRRHSSWLPDLEGDRAAGLRARCRAIVAPPDDVDALFLVAFDTHAVTHETDRARTLVAYGRTLIDLGRAEDAAQPLRAAAVLFRELRLPGWERHVAALRARVAETDDARVEVSDVELTEMEQQVLALVMQQRRNRDIATTLFVSLRTVESHLTRIFRKLGVSTKAQLYRQLATGEEGEADSRSLSRNSASRRRIG